MQLTLEQINAAPAAEAASLLDGLYEHSPWIAQAALAHRPFRSPAHLKHAMARIVAEAGREKQLALLRAHPELAGKAMVAKSLTTESTSEQSKAGPTNCTPDEFAKIQQLNAGYNAKFGFPFILAVKGPDGHGFTRQAIIGIFSRRLKNQRADEMAECLRQIHRIAELRFNDLLKVLPDFGPTLMQWSGIIGAWSEAEDGLTCSYMTPVHQRTAEQGIAEQLAPALKGQVGGDQQTTP